MRDDNTIASPNKNAEQERELRIAAEEKLAMAEQRIAELERQLARAGTGSLFTEMEHKLEEQRLFYERLLNNIPADIAAWNPEREYLFVNRSGIKDEFVRKWIIGKKDEDYFRFRNKPIEMAHNRVKLFNEVISTQMAVRIEEKFLQPDGQYIHHLRIIQPVLNELGELQMLIGYGIEITQQKRIAEQIERSEKRYRDIFNYSQALICTHDLTGKFLSVNPAICEAMEYTEEEMLGRLISEFVPVEHSTLFHDFYLHQISENGKFEGEFSVITKSGKKLFLLYQNYRVEEEGIEPYVIGFSQDITQRVEAERQLKDAKKVTEDTARAKEVFLANMSHEIRTPMNGVLGIATLLGKTSLDDQQKKYLGLIRESANNLLLIVNDVLDLEKIILGKLQFEDIDFSLTERTEKCIQAFTYKAEEKGITLVSKIEHEGDFWVSGDPYRLSQVLNNLISNAVKFTEKGSVTITMRIDEVMPHQTWIEFIVEDTGIGIPADKQVTIFEPFTQANSNVTRKYGGTGLGLSICRELVHMMGGALFLESEQGKGSAFRFVLPFVSSSLKPNPKTMSEEINYKSLGRKKILVAEDVELNQFLARHIMESWGFEVEIANNGREALDMVTNNEYDLVLMDIQMPEMDGMEATQNIRLLPDVKKAGIPIVALTANALKGDSDKYISVGMNDYLSKPFDESKLFLIISKNLSERKNASANVEKLHEAEVAKTGSDNQKLYDLSMVEAISGGDQQFVKKMIQLFLDTMPQALNDLEAELKQEKWESLGKLAHKMKSTIDSMGIVSLKQDIRAIEHNGKQQTALNGMSGLVAKIRRVMEACMNQVKKDYGL